MSSKIDTDVSNYTLEELMAIVGLDDLDPEEIIKKSFSSSKFLFLETLSEEELVVCYSLGDLFLFPSFYEGFGLPPLEALFCGAFVVSSKESALSEILEEQLMASQLSLNLMMI